VEKEIKKKEKKKKEIQRQEQLLENTVLVQI